MRDFEEGQNFECQKSKNKAAACARMVYSCNAILTAYAENAQKVITLRFSNKIES